MRTDPWELAEWDAVETRDRIRRGDVSAAEVVDAACARAEAVAPLNAIVTKTFDRARAAAPGATGPLAGVPTFVKDLAQMRGVRTTWGSASSGEYVSRRSDPIVRALEAAGLVSLGKSSTPEFGLTATTEPLRFGPCRNPWALDRTPGGSSGGAAALVAAGVVPIAHASDGGGSIRIPAACCGLVGLKPSRHRLDMEGSNLLPVNIAVDGVVTRTVRDTIAFFDAIERGRRRRLAPIGPIAGPTRRRLRLGVFVESPRHTPVDAAVRAAITRTAKLCEGLGHDVHLLPCPFDGQVVDDFIRLWGLVAWIQVTGGAILTHSGYEKARVEPFSRGFARAFATEPRAAFAAIPRLRAFPKEYAAVMAGFDALIGPTLAEVPPRLGHLATDQPFEETLARLLTFGPLTGLVNVAGAPAVSLPMGRTAEGVPIGVQFAAAHGNERTLLELALELEAAAPWPRLAPRSTFAAT